MARTVTVYALVKDGAHTSTFATISGAHNEARTVLQWKARTYEVEPLEVELSAQGVAEFVNRVRKL